jgi:hypothetical protein
MGLAVCEKSRRPIADMGNSSWLEQIGAGIIRELIRRVNVLKTRLCSRVTLSMDGRSRAGVVA